MSRIWYPSFEKRRASECTLVTSGQVASMVLRLRCADCSWTRGATPWAEKTTVAPSGTSSTSSTKTAPRASRDSTTNLLCTICLRTYTGAP